MALPLLYLCPYYWYAYWRHDWKPLPDKQPRWSACIYCNEAAHEAYARAPMLSIPPHAARKAVVDDMKAMLANKDFQKKWPMPIDAAAGALDQRQSPLFRKLPCEVRVMIWKDIMAGYNLMLDCSNEGHCHLIGISGITEIVAKLNPGDAFLQCRVVSILTTCRAVYAEAFETLYSQNRFVMGHFHAFKNMHQWWRPSQIEAVTNFRLDWHHYLGNDIDDEEAIHTIRDIWDTVQNMKGLRKLHIRMRYVFTLGDLHKEPTPELVQRCQPPHEILDRLSSFLLEIHFADKASRAHCMKSVVSKGKTGIPQPSNVFYGGIHELWFSHLYRVNARLWRP